MLDVNEDEARKLLLSIDPLAAMAETSRGRLQNLLAGVQANMRRTLYPFYRRPNLAPKGEIDRKVYSS